MADYTLRPIGVVRSSVVDRHGAPRQGYEGAPDAVIEVQPQFLAALDGIRAGDEMVVLTWLHEGLRDVLVVRPRKDPRNPLTGVFATRSPDRPNPIGLHRLRVTRIDGTRLEVRPLEVIDGTPVVDIKPVLDQSNDG
jgi:tRNA-Thr(GGU) m(6)t(6)A37 methyltransferase TsaA